MYKYDEYDRQMLVDRINQYRDQTQRYLAGKLSDAEFLPLRLQNGLYIQRLAPMLRVAIPYGLLSTKQLRKLSSIARTYDKGYAHFTTRQNVQFNWPRLEETPDILAELAEVEMHAIQTSGNCIRNTTTDQFAGVAVDEIEDSRPYCEIIRQWSTFHPEFAYLPRKFKIAVCGTAEDQAATQVHDIGLFLAKDAQGETGFRVLVGGGLGRTPVIGKEICHFLPKKHLLTYLDAILRVYNQEGRRDNKYKARIKILVKALGIDAFREKVEAEWQHLKDGPSTLNKEEFERCASFFTQPDYELLNTNNTDLAPPQLHTDVLFNQWVSRNVNPHQQPGYAIVTLCLKEAGAAPGDISASQLDIVADLADQYSFGEVRISHQQNIIFTDVKQSLLFEFWQKTQSARLATPNLGLLTDMICCPGGDFCALANAKSIPVAESIQRRFSDITQLHNISDLSLNISGCMNACGHHHVGNIGILGVDKKGQEFYQVTLGGAIGDNTALGRVVGPSFAQDEIPRVIETIIEIYLDERQNDEKFIDTYQRIGLNPFKEKIYAAAD